LLRAADVTFGYGETLVLRGVSIDVQDGGFVGVLGPNGSGKTTLLRVLAGTRRPRGGSVTLDDVDLARIPRATLARRMAVVPQETHLAFDYSVLEIVMMGRYPHLGAFELEGPVDHAAARHALDITGTIDFEDRAFATLSGGEKQRVVIAAALAQIAASRDTSRSGRRTSPEANRGAVLLLDEPTAALDLAYQLEIAALLRDLQQVMPISIVVSTHDLNFAASLCRSLVLLKEGRVVASGATEEVLTPPRIRDLYGVEADVHMHESAGHLVVVPIRPADPEESRGISPEHSRPIRAEPRPGTVEAR
jgi:iron complex transport system ATP-binding protein